MSHKSIMYLYKLMHKEVLIALKLQHINVGHCDGSCPGNHTEKTCLLRDKKNPARCLAGLYSKQYKCTPVRFKVHEYR